eukprot:131181_1
MDPQETGRSSQSWSQPTNEILLHSLQEQLRNGESNAADTDHIVRLLGGIDEILLTYLNHNVMLSGSIRTDLYHTMKTPNTHQTQTYIHQLQIQENHLEYYPNINIDLVMNENDTFFCGERGPTLYSIFHNNWVQSFCLGVIVLGTIWNNIIYLYGTPQQPSQMIVNILFMHYCIFWLLSMNRKGFSSIIRTFEFWFRLYYMVLGSTAGWIESESDGRSFPVYGRISAIAMTLSDCMMMIIIMSFDALNVARKWKALVSFFFGVLWGYWAVYYQFWWPDYVITIYGEMHVSIVGIQASAFKIISIFYFKQAFFTLFDKKKASVVSFKPYLKWVQSDEVTSVHGQQTKDEHNKQANGDEKVLEMIAKTKQIPFDPESTSLASGPDSDSDHYEEETSK